MSTPTEKQIRDECAALRAMRAGDLTRVKHQQIEAMVDALTGHIDTTAPEFSEMTEHERTAAMDAMEWRDGLTQRRPTQTF